MQLRKILQPLVIACSFTAAATSQAACPFNIAGTGAISDPASFDAMRDGVLLVRYAQGLRGAALVNGTGISDFTTVQNNIINNLAALDMNGNGVLDIDDATVIARNVYGFDSSKWLPASAVPQNYATRAYIGPIKAFVDGGCLPPSVSAPTSDQLAASRFLIQTTFGPSRADIASFLTLPGADHKTRAGNWLNAQFALTRPKTHFQYTMDRKAEYDAQVPPATFYSEMSRETFWGQALKNQDQLRQRLAFALSEVLVVSDNGGSNDPFELASYLDLLADNGYGNFRDLLYKVSQSPAMGRYLSHLRNDGGSSTPNENFAREILQLFGVGLVMLNPDGTATATPSYDENTVKGFAKVFTGLSYDDPYCKTGDPAYGITLANCLDGYGDRHPSWYWSPDRTDLGATFPPVLTGWGRPMIPFPGKHSALSKQMLKYTTYPGAVASCAAAITLASPVASGGADGILPAINTTGSGVTSGTRVNATQAYDVYNKAIDNIFCHPNVAPFIGKHLIKFLVTSTPTPAYVQRVAAVFNDNGSGVRGDMKAVLRAILLDDEAINPTGTLVATDLMKFGKLKEPVLRLSAIFRGFNATATSGRYQLTYINDVEYGISQGPLQSPTVFNYFHPDFSPPGPIAQNSALGPEFEITTTTAIASTMNFFGSTVTRTDGNLAVRQMGVADYGNCDTSTGVNFKPADCIISDLSDLYAVQDNSGALFDQLNLVLMGGQLSAGNKTTLQSALDSAYPVYVLPANPTAANITTWQDRKRDRVKGAMWLAVHTPEFQIQR